MIRELFGGSHEDSSRRREREGELGETGWCQERKIGESDTQCVWTLLEDNENNERPNELKYLSTMLVVAARTKFEEMDLLAYGFGGCNHFEPRNSVHYLLGHFQGLGSHEPQLQQLQGGAWDDEYENDDDDYAEKWRRRGNDGNGSATGSFGSGSERSKFCKRV
ncbi:hypothetical protein Bca101_047775 [Brassica carinata]